MKYYIRNHEQNKADAFSKRASSEIVPLWSFGKTIVAAAILKLVQQGTLDLSQNYYGLNGNLFQVLRHEAGLGDYYASKKYFEAVDNKETAWTPDQMMKIVNGDKLIFDPGEGWMYSNIGYYYLRKLIVDTTQTTLNNALRLLVLDEDLDEIKVIEGMTSNGESTYIAGDYDSDWVYPGMFVGTLKSACLFLDKLAQGEILSIKYLDMMLDPYVLGFDIGDRPWKIPAYGCGIMIDNQKGEKYSFGHTGMGPGSVIAIYHYPNGNQPITVGAIIESTDQGEVEKLVVEYLKEIIA